MNESESLGPKTLPHEAAAESKCNEQISRIPSAGDLVTQTDQNAAGINLSANQDLGVLCKIFVEHDGYGSDKWEHYLLIYGAALSKFIARGQPVRLLEIGVQNGGSLQIWSKYLPQGSTIIGIDVDPACAGLPIGGENISVRIGDASDPVALERMLGSAEFDVIIDDGSHRSDHVIATFKACFGRLSPGGLYVAEDLHCSYYASHGGGFRHAGTSIEWMKGLVDALNVDHFEDDAGAALNDAELQWMRVLGSQIAQVTFFDSVVVIEKLVSEKQQPYRRIRTGREFPVFDLASDIPILPAAQLRTLLLTPSATASFAPALLNAVASAREEVGELRGTLTALKVRLEGEARAASEREAQQAALGETRLAEEIERRKYAEQRAARAERLLEEQVGQRAQAEEQAAAEHDRRVFELSRTIAERNGQVFDLKAKGAALEEKLSAIYQSTSWRITGPLRRSVSNMRALPAVIRRASDFGLIIFRRSRYVLRHYGFRDFLTRSNRFVRMRWSHKTAQFRLRNSLKKPTGRTGKEKADAHPIVSFIIPVHDRTDMLRTAVQSALNQTFPAIEVIIVTNGSPPETLAVLDEFRDDPRVRVFSYFRDNTGNAVRGRNKGLLEARGDYIAFLDSDDIADPGRVELSLPQLTSGQADVVYGAWQVMMDGTRQIDGLVDGQVIYSPDCDLEMLTKTNVPYQSTVMVRKNLFNTAGFLKPQMQYREDHELWTRFALHGAVFKSVPHVLTRIRLHGGNTELKFKGNDAHWEKMMVAEYKIPGPKPKKIAFILGGVGINGGTAVVFRHIMMLMAAGHDAFAINLGDPGDGGAWFTGNTAPIIHISDKRLYLFDNIDLLFATGWMTAAWLSLISARRKLYFVQADERRFVDEPALRAKIHAEYETECEYLTEARWIQKMLRTEFGHQSAYVPNGIDPTVFYPDTPIEPKNPKRLRVLIEGPICIPYKGMDDAYAAISPLDCDIWIVSSVGRPQPEWRYDRFFEGVPFGEMRKIYSSCDVFLKMSRVEGFFGPPMEAMACGCSVVVGKVSGYDEYIVHEENALVAEQGDVYGASRAVQRLLSDAALREQLVKRGFETAKAWTWEQSAKAMLALVEKEQGEIAAEVRLPISDNSVGGTIASGAGVL